MEIFIDTAKLDEIKQAAAMGVLDGVTTNPTLLSRQELPFREALTEICRVVDGPVSAEVVATDAEGMIKEAQDLATIASNITIKIPSTKEGLVAIKALSEKERKMIDVVSVGSVRLFDQNSCGSAKNIVAMRDVIPGLCGSFHGSFFKSTVPVEKVGPSWQGPLAAHMFLSSHYQEALQRVKNAYLFNIWERTEQRFSSLGKKMQE